MESEFNIDFSTKQLILEKSQILRHYSVCLLPVFLFIVLAFTDHTLLNIYLVSGLVITCLILFILQKRLLNFKEYQVDCSQDQLLDAFKRSARTLDWRIDSESTIMYAFDSNPSENNRQVGNVIIVAKTDTGYIINTLSDPRIGVTPLFRPLESKNRMTFHKHLEDVLAGNSYNEEFDF